MADGKAMSEKILRTLESIINRDPDLQEFCIVPTDDNSKNKSPVLYEQHNLGLESWCVKHVYNYACSVLFNLKELLWKRKLTACKMDSMNTFLIGAILINPDVGTFWNMRRTLVELDALSVEKELYLSKIVLTCKSKSNEAFSYRRWLLNRIESKISRNDTQTFLRIMQNEFAIVHTASERSPNNYHSWNHRIWCTENILGNTRSVSDMVYAELNYSQEWINTHVSEYSGYHYRQYLLELVRTHKDFVFVFESYYNFVIKHFNLINDGEFSNLLVYLLGKQNKMVVLEESNSYLNYISMLLYDLLVFADKMNKSFPGHESLFYHRRFLVHHLLKFSYDYHEADFSTRNKSSGSNSIGSSGGKNMLQSDVIVNVKNTGSDDRNMLPKSVKVPLNKVESCNLHRILVNNERQFVLENTNNACGAAQVKLTKQYQKWLRCVMGFE